MTSAMLFFDGSRERIIPVNTYDHPATMPYRKYLSDVTYHLENILQKFFVEPLQETLYALEDASDLHSIYEDDDEYGNSYAPQLADDKIPLPENAYKAATLIAKQVINSRLWVLYLTESNGYIPTGYTVQEISEEAPSTGLIPPVDPRYNIGDELINSSGRAMTYAGVLYDHIDSRVNHLTQQNKNNTILIGIENMEFIQESVVQEFIQNTTINFYPLPMVSMRHVRKGSKWFAQTPKNTTKEGIGSTPEEAIENLALKIIFSQLRQEDSYYDES